MGPLIKDCSLRREGEGTTPFYSMLIITTLPTELKLQIVHHANVSCV